MLVVHNVKQKGANMTVKLVSTTCVPTSIIVKKVVLRPPTEETEAQREKRLKQQAAANHIRVTDNHDGTYTVTSQTRDETGQRAEPYLVVPNGSTWVCHCQWGENHVGSCCAHIAQVRAHRRRKHQPADPVASERTMTDIMIERADAARKARGRTAYREEI